MNILGMSGIRDTLDTYIFIADRENESVKGINCTKRIHQIKRAGVKDKDSFVRWKSDDESVELWYKYYKEFDIVLMTTKNGLEIVKGIVSDSKISKAKSLLLGVKPKVKLEENKGYFYIVNSDKHFIAIIPDCDIINVSDKVVVEMNKKYMRNIVNKKNLVAMNKTKDFFDGDILNLMEKQCGYNIMTSLTDWVVKRTVSGDLSLLGDIGWRESSEDIIICEISFDVHKCIVHEIHYDENYVEIDKVSYFDNKDDKLEYLANTGVNILFSL